jgi:hypothetical protein
MSERHLFSFGYESPDEYRWNRANDTDDESSAAFWITAASEQEALRWGQMVADRFVSWLFERAGTQSYAWSQGRYANWIETDPSTLAACRAANLPAVGVGEDPPFEALAN